MKNVSWEAPALLKHRHLKRGRWQRRRGSHCTAIWKLRAILAEARIFLRGRCMTENPHTLPFHKELESAGLEMERVTAYPRWTSTVCEERCSSLDMVLWKKNIKPIKMTNIASIFHSPSVEISVITYFWLSTLLALCSYPWLPVGKRYVFSTSDSYYTL